jgi:hypothetical protein
MPAIELTGDALEAVRREAERRGVDVTEVVTEAVERFVVGSDLQKLLAEFRQQDERRRPDSLTEEQASRVSSEELAAVRQRRC